MKRKIVSILITNMIILIFLSGCSSNSEKAVEKMPQTETEKVAPTDVSDEEKEAEDTLKKEAEANEAYEKGREALYGLNGNEVDLVSASTNFKKSLELGKTDANFYLGVLSDWYSYPEVDYIKSKEYYEKCPDNPYSQISLAFLYYYGNGVEQDYAKALKWFEKAAELGHETAAENVKVVKEMIQ